MNARRRSGTQQRRGGVFVSYASADRDRVRTIVDHLTSRGIDVWWDDRLEPGDPWRSVLRQKLDGAACVVVIWTRTSVGSDFVAAEVGTALDTSMSKGRLVPVLLDADAEAEIPLPFGELQHLDLTAWDGVAVGPLRTLAGVVERMAKRPHTSSEWESNLGDEWQVRSARSAAVEIRRLTKRVGSVGEILVGGGAAADIRAALVEVHKTLEVVSDAVEEFVAAGVTDDGIDRRPYVRFERGKLDRQIRDGRGHCDLIALHYGRRGGVREWLAEHASKRVLARADRVFARLSEADGDLFEWLGQIGGALTNESRVIVNLLTAQQPDAARRRIAAGRKRLAPLEAELDKSVEVLQQVEHSLGFAAPI